MLTTRNLVFTYPRRETLKFPDIHIGEGEQWLLLGQSGSGKTTLLQLLAGLRRPGAGTILINSTDVTALARQQLDRFRGQQLGIIFQQSHFVQALSVLDNLRLARKLAGRPANDAYVRQLLERLNIGNLAGALPQRLSVGEQQRAAIARALVHQPSIILADEPTSALDDQNTAHVIALLRQQALEAKAALLIITHDNRLKSEFDQRIQL